MDLPAAPAPPAGPSTPRRTRRKPVVIAQANIEGHQRSSSPQPGISPRSDGSSSIVRRRSSASSSTIEVDALQSQLVRQDSGSTPFVVTLDSEDAANNNKGPPDEELEPWMVKLREGLAVPPEERSDELIQSLVEICAPLTFFQTLPEKLAAQVLKFATYRAWEPDGVIFRRGDPGDFFYITLTDGGEVRGDIVARATSAARSVSPASNYNSRGSVNQNSSDGGGGGGFSSDEEGGGGLGLSIPSPRPASPEGAMISVKGSIAARGGGGGGVNLPAAAAAAAGGAMNRMNSTASTASIVSGKTGNTLSPVGVGNAGASFASTPGGSSSPVGVGGGWNSTNGESSPRGGVLSRAGGGGESSPRTSFQRDRSGSMTPRRAPLSPAPAAEKTPIVNGTASTGQFVRTIKAGEAVGELALLNDAKRSALFINAGTTYLHALLLTAQEYRLILSAWHIKFLQNSPKWSAKLQQCCQKVGGRRTDDDIQLLMITISQNKFFEKLPIHVQRRCCRYIRWARASAKEIIFTQGSVGDLFYIILNGSVDISITDVSGKSTVVGKLGTGGSFGELALINDSPRAATITCVDDCEMLTLSKEAYEIVLKKQQLGEVMDKMVWIKKLLPAQFSYGEKFLPFMSSLFNHKSFKTGETICERGQSITNLAVVVHGVCTVTAPCRMRCVAPWRLEGEENAIWGKNRLDRAWAAQDAPWMADTDAGKLQSTSSTSSSQSANSPSAQPPPPNFVSGSKEKDKELSFGEIRDGDGIGFQEYYAPGGKRSKYSYTIIAKEPTVIGEVPVTVWTKQIVEALKREQQRRAMVQFAYYDRNVQQALEDEKEQGWVPICMADVPLLLPSPLATVVPMSSNLSSNSQLNSHKHANEEESNMHVVFAHQLNSVLKKPGPTPLSSSGRGGRVAAAVAAAAAAGTSSSGGSSPRVAKEEGSGILPRVRSHGDVASLNSTGSVNSSRNGMSSPRLRFLTHQDEDATLAMSMESSPINFAKELQMHPKGAIAPRNGSLVGSAKSSPHEPSPKADGASSSSSSGIAANGRYLGEMEEMISPTQNLLNHFPPPTSLREDGEIKNLLSGWNSADGSRGGPIETGKLSPRAPSPRNHRASPRTRLPVARFVEKLPPLPANHSGGIISGATQSPFNSGTAPRPPNQISSPSGRAGLFGVGSPSSHLSPVVGHGKGSSGPGSPSFSIAPPARNSNGNSGLNEEERANIRNLLQSMGERVLRGEQPALNAVIPGVDISNFIHSVEALRERRKNRLSSGEV